MGGLSCHTDLNDCCRANETKGQGGLGDWYYPNGSVVQNSQNSEGNLHRGRNHRSVNLLRKKDFNLLSPTGSYCCEIPTNGGNMTLCANIGM